MNTVQILFWLSLGILFYGYIGYGIIAGLITLLKEPFKGRKRIDPVSEIPLTIIVTAYQEEAVLPQKIDNILSLDYPKDLLKIIFVIDEPSPTTIELFAVSPFIRLVQQPVRTGKYKAIKKAMELVDTPVVIFSDANSILNPKALRKIVPHFADEKTGAVAGEKKILYQQQHSAVGQAEGWYWKYESFMKRLDSGLYSVVGAAGELFAMRTTLFYPLEGPVILDDLVISMQACLKGYRISYEPEAYASELPSASLFEEEKRKTRIASGAFQSIKLLSKVLNPFYRPVLFFQFLSRRIFRWIFGPLSMLLLLLTNAYLVYVQNIKGNYETFVYIQFVLYFMALVGFLLIRKGRHAGLCNIPFYFIFMNYCMIKGFFRNLDRQPEVNWEKVQRQSITL